MEPTPNTPASRARTFGACPHCGISVLFEGDGRCPACRRSEGEPVTASDQATAAQNAAAHAQRVAEDRAEPRRVVDTTAIAGGAAMILLGVGISVGGAAMTNNGGFRIFYGLVLVGARILFGGLRRRRADGRPD